MELIPCEDNGFEIRKKGSFVGWVFPDIFNGWRPYSVYGRVMNSGYPAYKTPEQAANFNEEAEKKR